MAILVSLKWLLNKMLRPQGGQWRPSPWRTAIVIPDTGRSGMLCALSGRLEVALLITDIASSPMNDSGKIVGPARDPKLGRSSRGGIGSWNRRCSRRSWRPEEASWVGPLLRLGFHKLPAGQHDPLSTTELLGGSLEWPVCTNRHTFAGVHAPIDRGR